MAKSKLKVVVTPGKPQKSATKAKSARGKRAATSPPTVDLIFDPSSRGPTVWSVDVPFGRKRSERVRVRVQPIPLPELPTPDRVPAEVKPFESPLAGFAPEGSSKALTAPAASLVVCGGQKIIFPINGTKVIGTVTAPCKLKNGSPGFLTASHVVYFKQQSLGENVSINDNAPQDQVVGTVFSSGFNSTGPSNVLLDVATVKLNAGIQVKSAIRSNGQTWPIAQFDGVAVDHETVFHGGIHSHGQFGNVNFDFSPLIVDDQLSGRTYKPEMPLFKIEKNGTAFCQSGDSGAPVFRMRADGKVDLLGVLIAMDPQGNGYAHSMGSVGDDKGIVAQMKIAASA